MKNTYLILLCTLCSVPVLAQQQEIKRPNVLFILADDLGYTDLTCTGSQFHETPNLDRLAKEGTVFTQAYAACPVSSPSRGAIMTGKYPARINLTDYIPGNRAYGPHKDQQLAALPFNLHLASNEKGLASALKDQGYATYFAGKWHLGEEEHHYPDHFGFDVNIGGNKTGHPAGGYFAPYKNPQMSDGPKGEYLTDRLTDEVIQYMQAEKNKPFFAYLSYYSVHLPLQAKAEKIAKYQRKLDKMTTANPAFLKVGATYYKQQQDVVKYAAMVESLDENIGRLLQSLKDLGLDENTIIIFTSDNGGMATSNQTGNIPTSNYPLRAGKGHLYEGGIKVPSFVRWKGHIPANRVCPTPITGTDYYPTILDLCGLDLDTKQHQDGVSLLPLLQGQQIDRPAIYWHYPHYSGGLGGRPAAAIRSGNYKLIEFFEDNHVELYDLANDISEQNDLSKAFPALTKQLKEQLHGWYSDVKAVMPVPNKYYINKK